MDLNDGQEDFEDDFDIDAQENPFALHREDIFLLREREKKKKEEERRRQKTLKIWEKGPAPKQTLARTSGIGRGTGSRSRTAKALTSKQDRMFQGRRREKENMADFIAKKRDMFLIQMSLDTKRAEIKKLEQKAQMKDAALKESEKMLEEDALRFDRFLKENDRKAHDAIKKADNETKIKQEKSAEIKKLLAEINKVDNEISKYKDQLKSCVENKKFLDKLTPSEHKEMVTKRKAERRAAKNGSAGTLEVAADAKQKSRRGSASTQGGQDEDDALLALAGLDIDDSDDEDDMYFKRPEQLLDIFADLEGDNLFLIQNVQETEEALEELKQKFEDTKAQMEEKTKQLEFNIGDLNAKIKIENDKSAALKKRTRANSIAGNQQELLSGLSEKVKEVYVKCGFDADTQTDTLDMLREVEGWLEQLLGAIATMDHDKVKEAEKAKQNERRIRVRAAKKKEQQRQYEERLAKSTARAKAEVIRRTGKQVMFRSAPVRKKKKKEDDGNKKDDEAEEIKKFFQ